MTSQLTREWLQHQISEIEVAGITDSNTLAAFKLALASMDSEPVAWDYEWASCITCEGPQDFKRVIEREVPPEWAIEEGQARNVIPLYRHARQPVVPDGLIAAVNRLLDSDGSRGCYSAIRCLDAREEVERLLAAAQKEVNHG